jgi:hypothetical protein
MDSVRVADNPEKHRYEVFFEDQLAGFATYRIRDTTIVIRHTEVFPEFEHHGLAGELAHAMLDDIRRRGLRVVPQCPFTAKYIREHPDYADLVSDVA